MPDNKKTMTTILLTMWMFLRVGLSFDSVSICMR